MTAGIIFYSDGRIAEPIKSWAEGSIYASDLQVVASILEPGAPRGYPVMVRQILSCLERSVTDVVFFAEHDVLYPPDHWRFRPEHRDRFYYNANVWRWDYPADRFVTYDRLICLSGLMADRRLALDHYRRRLAWMVQRGCDAPHAGEPYWLRRMGYEPGTKTRKRGGFSDEAFETWRSDYPIIDIRHGQTFSPRKVDLAGFMHAPTGWREATGREIGFEVPQ